MAARIAHRSAVWDAMQARLHRYHPPQKDEPQEPVKLPDDWVLHFPINYIMTCFDLIEMSDWQVLPEAGGLNEQDAQMIDDVMFLFSLRRYIFQTQESGGDDGGG